MTDFWLATFTAAVSSQDGGIASQVLAVEILKDGDDWAVLLSNVRPTEQRELACFLAFTNATQACNTWHERGFPIIDAAIRREASGAIRVDCPCFRDQSRMEYESDFPLLRIHGVAFERGDGEGAGFLWNYHQDLRTPDTVQPDIWLTRRAITWTPKRSEVRHHKESFGTSVDIDVGPAAARSPSLAPLGTVPMQRVDVWSGSLQLPSSGDGRLDAGRQRVKATDTFGLGAFRFENVEVLGFRIEVGPELADELAALIEPLNFHLQPTDTEIPDFRYRVATHTVIIELLRYGAMKSKGPLPPIRSDDCQSQHELTIRLLVGRVDDDSAQARAPAIYVPAIFVDNPWSKNLGRQFLGFDKLMAQFFAPASDGTEVALLPDGRPRSSNVLESMQTAMPLGTISRIDLVERTGEAAGKTLLELRYASVNHTDPDELQPVDLSLAMRASGIANARWRQADFATAPEFRRSFATRALGDSFRSIRNIQVSPVAEFVERHQQSKTWITGAFLLDDGMRFALPAGAATLTLHELPTKSLASSNPSTVHAWNLLCRMLGDGPTAEVVVPTGSWYRLSSSMDLTVDDGLEWNDLGG